MTFMGCWPHAFRGYCKIVYLCMHSTSLQGHWGSWGVSRYYIDFKYEASVLKFNDKLGSVPFSWWYSSIVFWFDLHMDVFLLMVVKAPGQLYLISCIISVLIHARGTCQKCYGSASFHGNIWAQFNNHSSNPCLCCLLPNYFVCQVHGGLGCKSSLLGAYWVNRKEKILRSNPCTSTGAI